MRKTFFIALLLARVGLLALSCEPVYARQREDLPSEGAKCLPAGAAPADDEAVGRILRQVGQDAVVRAAFEQTKHMASLKKPLVLSGRLMFSRRYGTLWTIEKPFETTYALTEDKLAVIGGDGARIERNGEELPGFAQVGRVFRAMMDADLAVLRDYFDVGAAVSSGRWTMALTPQARRLAPFLSGACLSGSRFIETLTIVEADGSFSVIRFVGAASGHAPNDAERQLFGIAP